MVVPADKWCFQGRIMPPKTKQCKENGKPSRKGIGGPKNYQEKAKNDPNQRKVSEMFFKKKSSESASCEDSENSNTDKSKQNSVQTENQGNSAGWWHNFSHFHHKFTSSAES